MNALDALLVIVAIAAIVGGYRLGFTARMLSWVGLAMGLVLGLRLLPWVVRRTGSADQNKFVFLAAAVVIAAVALGQGLGLWLGSRLTPALEGERRPPPTRCSGDSPGSWAWWRSPG